MTPPIPAGWTVLGILLLLLGACQAPPAASPSTATPAPTATRPAPTATVAAPTPSPTLAPPVSDAPAAGICAQAEGEWATVEINADVPSPRCLQVTALQKLKVINRTAAALQVRLAGYAISVPAGGEGTIPVPFGSYLAPGVHSGAGRALQRPRRYGWLAHRSGRASIPAGVGARPCAAGSVTSLTCRRPTSSPDRWYTSAPGLG